MSESLLKYKIEIGSFGDPVNTAKANCKQTRTKSIQSIPYQKVLATKTGSNLTHMLSTVVDAHLSHYSLLS